MKTAPEKTALLWKITIGFGVIASLIGLTLRYYFVSPMGFNFKNVLHAHSHLMLLGWLFNALLLLVYRQWNLEIPKRHVWWFLGICVCVAGMLFSFPFQGYAAVSITFSTLHLWLSYILLVGIWKLSRNRGLPGMLVRTGIFFFFLSTIGPYALGPMMANDMQSSPWYNQAIFFYLHFQYNGAFLFFMLAFMLEKWKKANVEWKEKTFLILMTAGVALTWFHTLDYSFDSIWINIAGGMGSVFQLWAGLLFLRVIDRNKRINTQLLVLAMLLIKWLLQVLGSFPAIADMVVHNRFYFIAYLHFIFLGIFTPFIWANLRDKIRGFSSLIAFYWLFFFLTETALVMPFLYQVSGFYYWPQLTFGLYCAFVLVWLILARRAMSKGA